MINKIADNHFNLLQFGSADTTSLEGDQIVTPHGANDALNKFLSSPSFNTKQIAIESLLRQITQGAFQTGTT